MLLILLTPTGTLPLSSCLIVTKSHGDIWHRERLQGSLASYSSCVALDCEWVHRSPQNLFCLLGHIGSFHPTCFFSRQEKTSFFSLWPLSLCAITYPLVSLFTGCFLYSSQRFLREGPPLPCSHLDSQLARPCLASPCLCRTHLLCFTDFRCPISTVWRIMRSYMWHVFWMF